MIKSIIIVGSFFALFSLFGCAGTMPSSGCCKTCTEGKACGDGCIEKSKECHQPKGCACDG
jgi:hypothetical protein